MQRYDAPSGHIVRPVSGQDGFGETGCEYRRTPVRRIRFRELRRQAEAAVLDSLQKARIERSLLPAAAPEPLKPPIR